MPRQNACVLTWLSRWAVRLKSAIAVIFCIRESREIFDIEKQRLAGRCFFVIL
jgi:hypothetical protein